MAWMLFRRPFRAIGALLVPLLLAGPALAVAPVFTLTDAESASIHQRGIVIRSSLDANERKGTVRAAMIVDAPPAIVFEKMTRCEDALGYVPHMKRCRVREQAADGTWLLVEHKIDFGWYSPAIEYVFRADLVADRSIAFHQVSGDFKTNEGIWDFEPMDEGARTLLRYRVTIDPPGFVPNWLARSTFKRELPELLRNLRGVCEAERLRRTPVAKQSSR
jgi:ribosome-associated toxin RatA of RatAB toxin-antitoxin module